MNRFYDHKTLFKKLTSRDPSLIWWYQWLLIAGTTLFLGKLSTAWSTITDPQGGLTSTNHNLCCTLLAILGYCLLGIILKLISIIGLHRFTRVSARAFIIAVTLGLTLGAAYDGSFSLPGVKFLLHFALITPCLLIGVGFLTTLQQWQQARLTRTYRWLFCIGFLTPLLPSLILLLNHFSGGYRLGGSCCTSSSCHLGSPSAAEFVDYACLGYLLSILLWLGWMMGVGFKAIRTLTRVC